MPAKLKIKKGDKVVVTTGKYAGKESSVLATYKEEGKVLVEGVNVVKRHTKPNQTNPDGGIIEKTLPIDISNVMYHCDSCKKGVRVGYKGEKKDKVRICKSCGKELD